jgi:hypothetical protein
MTAPFSELIFVLQLNYKGDLECCADDRRHGFGLLRQLFGHYDICVAGSLPLCGGGAQSQGVVT